MRAGAGGVGDNPPSSHAETRMQRQTLLVSAAIFALLACATWFLSVRAPVPGARAQLPEAQQPSPASVRPQVPAAPAMAMPAPAPTLLPAAPAAAPMPQSAIAATSAEADATKDSAVEAPADPAPADAASDAAGAEPVPATPENGAVTDPSPATDTPADAADAASPPDDSAHAVPSSATTADPHDVRAADLFAQRIEALDDPPGDDAQDAHAAAAQHAYEARDEGGDAAKATQAIVHDVFANWLAGLHMDNSQPSLISIDCREGACRVLIAQAGIDFSGAAQLERESPVNAFSRALTELSHGAAWSDAGLALQDSQMTAAGGTAEKANDIALWTIYLGVATGE